MERWRARPPWAVSWVASWPALRAALRAVAESPREGWELGEVALRHLKRPTPSALSGLARRPPDALAWSRPSWEGWQPAAQPKPSREADAALVWGAQRAMRRAAQEAAGLRAVRGRGRGGTRAERRLWAWAEAVEGARQELGALLRGAFGGLEGRPPSEGALLALLDDPTYARAWGLLRALSGEALGGAVPGFVEASEAAPYHYIYGLAEATAAALAGALGPLAWSPKGRRAWVARVGAGGWARLEVAPSFGGAGGPRGSLASGPHPRASPPVGARFGPFPLSGEGAGALAQERAGVAVGWRGLGGGGGKGWAWVDVRGLFGAGMDELCRRRGAWVWDEFGGLARGGLLASEGGAGLEEGAGSRGLLRYGVGAAQVRPGVEEGALRGWLVGLLGG